MKNPRHSRSQPDIQQQQRSTTTTNVKLSCQLKGNDNDHDTTTATTTSNLFYYPQQLPVHQIHALATTTFQNLHIPEPSHSTSHLLSHALSLPYATGFATLLDLTPKNPLYDLTLTTEQAQIFSQLCQRRARHEPLQYIIGRWDFYDFTIKCESPILCPRPETEELVDIVRDEIRDLLLLLRRCGSSKKVRVLDVGCGTGVIGIAIAKLFPDDVEVVAIDVDREAVALSKENAATVLGGDCYSRVYKAVVASAVDFGSSSSDDEPFDIVVSNPPYIPSEDMLGLSKDVIEYESRQALCGGDDGMDVIRSIVDNLSKWTDGKEGQLWMEVDTSHPKLIDEWIRNDESIRRRVEFVESRKDLSRRDRFVKLRVVNDGS